MSIPQDMAVPKFTRKAFLIRMGVGVLVLNLVVILMALVSLRQSWHNHQDRAISTAQNLTLVLDHYVADTLTKTDLAVWAVKDEVERTLALPQGSHSDLDGFIRRQYERVPGLQALRTTDAKGVIDHESGASLGSLANIGDRDYFIRHRDAPDTGLVVSRPVVGKITGKWLITLSRRIERPDHTFAGIVYAAITLEAFEKAFSALEIGPHGSVAIRDLELGLIARHPNPSRVGIAVGQKVVSPEMVAFAQSGRSSGWFQARFPIDQTRRTYSARKVSGQPFYLVVGLAEQDYLAEWRREALVEISELVLFTSLTLVASWLIYSDWVRQQVTQKALEKLLSEVKTLGDMIPICSHCKKIRDDKGFWNQIEAYLNEHIDAEFTHGICPDCAKAIFPLTSRKHTSM